MSVLGAAVASGDFNHMSARSSALVVTNTRRVAGFSIGPTGLINEVMFTLEYFEGGTRVTLGDKRCVVTYKHSNYRYTLVHVLLSHDNVKPLHELWSGVMGGKLMGRNGNDCFVTVSADEPLTTFYPDGTVALFHKWEQSTTPFKFNLSAAHAFDARFGQVSRMIAGAERLQGNDKILKLDRNLHELASIVGMSKRYPELRKQVVDYVVELGIPLRKNVFDHFCKACTNVSDMNAWMQIRSFNDNIGVSPVSKTGAPKGKPVDEKARKAARANRDRGERAQMKGVARSNDSNNHKNKKK